MQTDRDEMYKRVKIKVNNTFFFVCVCLLCVFIVNLNHSLFYFAVTMTVATQDNGEKQNGLVSGHN